MRSSLHAPLALALCAVLAACSSEAPPPATDAADADAKSGAASQAAVHDPRAPNSSAASRTPVAHGPSMLENTDRPGDMPRVTATGRVECDQFAEKLRQCVNSGTLSAQDRETLRSEFVVALNGAKFKTADLAKSCLDIQEKLQPRLVQAGCRNF